MARDMSAGRLFEKTKGGWVLFQEDHFLNLGELTGFQFIEIDSAGKSGGIKDDGVIARRFFFID